MALQGALETFDLDDVLRLLASTGKSGLLTLSGDRGSGRVWVDDGQVVQAAVDVDTTLVEHEADAVFHMLRFATGEYLFEDGVRADAPVDQAQSIDRVLADAQERLEEWTATIAVVVGLDSWLTLPPTIDEDIEVDTEAWQRLAMIGSGCSIREMGAQLAEAELCTMRAVKGLVERGLVDVGEASAPLPDLEPIEAADPVEYVATVEADDVDAADGTAYASPADGYDTEAGEMTESEPAAEVFDTGVAEPVEYDFAVDADAAAADQPTSDVPASWQTAAPASAWEGDQESADVHAPISEWTYEAPVGVEGEVQQWPAVEPVGVETVTHEWDTPEVVGAEQWPAPAEAVGVEEWPAPAEAVGVEEWPAPAEAVGAEQWPAPAEAVGAEEWPAPAEAVGAEQWPAPAEAVGVEQWPAPAEAVGAEQWPAPAEAVGAEQWPAPVEAVAAETSIESLYDTSDDDEWADAKTGAIEYGDGAFDQAAEALGWGEAVDNSPEGFWGEKQPVLEPAGMAADEASEMARQLASLSPAAARAVADAARATTPEEREAALAQAEAEDASVDRSLLLRFLGSFDS
ncbi:MAG: DUF4388 domain-containing protein [Acidimicrobiia bacterium]|nr:DUF4388 domain-containing protein [Acidimicrobiia bacterium]